MIDHVNIPVTDLDASRRFYDEALLPLGVTMVAQDGPAIGYGRAHWSFGIEATERDFPKLHVAYAAASREQVDGFYAAAMTAGAISNGEPGLRPDFGEAYYAAYVLDPDAHNIEAVFRG